MSYAPDKDKELSTDNKPGNKCYGCGLPICFTKKAETPSGKPTRNPSTGRVIPLDPETQEYHICKPQYKEAYSETDDEYRKRIAEWKSRQQQKNFESISNNIYRHQPSVLVKEVRQPITNAIHIWRLNLRSG